MRFRFLPGLLVPLACVAADTAAPAIPGKTPAPAGKVAPPAKPTFTEASGEWTDPARDGRKSPWRAFLPANTGKPVPVVIVSHGLGGTRDAMLYLGEHLAAHGIATVHIQHTGSDDGVWKGKPALQILPAMKEAANAKNASDRVADVTFVLDRLALESTKDAKSPFAGRLDLSKAGIAGHSFGALTSLTVAGVRVPLRPGAPTKEPRIKAALLLSPPAPRLESPALYADVTIPVFTFTGTKDVSPIDGGTDPADRRKHFAHFDKAPAWLVVFDGGDHGVYSGTPARRATPASANYPVWQACVCDLSLDFFKAGLENDPEAKKHLTREAVATRVGKLGVVSVKP